ncbi:hypothetical protein LTR37_010658 [Vermiconidia calcicola]|uniref:Uncharacterized protein n=1 Tax=Vermiconidia calcicola TaxID=1690605 RepID=A0ACC3N5K1_9PEZI|nr:hypothetical protein LTR37_010658 [Vermiconidia calcicola]
MSDRQARSRRRLCNYDRTPVRFRRTSQVWADDNEEETASDITSPSGASAGNEGLAVDRRLLLFTSGALNVENYHMQRRNAFSGPSPEELRHHTHLRSVNEWLNGFPSEAEMDSVHYVDGVSDGVSSSRPSDSDRRVALQTIAEEPEDEGIDTASDDIWNTSNSLPNVARTSSVQHADTVTEASTRRLFEDDNYITALETIAEESEDVESVDVIIEVESEQWVVDMRGWTWPNGTRRRPRSDDESS